MIRNNKSRKLFASFLLIVYTIQLLAPLQTFALTSGPSQPEFSSFQSADISNIVNTFTGDMSYNLPLIDVDGYPLNLSYQSGIGIDDEASWVGLGWNLNVGTINRHLRGVADDMHGTGEGVTSGDDLKVSRYAKDKTTIGVNHIVKSELAGLPANDLIGISGSLSVGIFSDSYTGIGAELSSNAGLSVTAANANRFTANLGLSSNTNSGVNRNVGLTMSARDKESAEVIASLTASVGHNTRSGFRDLNLSSSMKGYNKSMKEKGLRGGDANLIGSSISFNDVVYSPNIPMPAKTFSGSASFDAGPAITLLYFGIGFSGYFNKRTYEKSQQSYPQFGFLYSHKGQDIGNAVHDFQSEKESAFVPEIPTLPITVPQPDLFSFNNQLANGQFRLFRSGSGVFYNTEARDENEMVSLGADFGAGAGIHAGGSIYEQSVSNGNRKWADKNNAIDKLRFKTAEYNNDEVFFKAIGEFSEEESSYHNLIQNDHPVSLGVQGESLSDRWNISSGNGKMQNAQLSTVKRSGKVARNTLINYLTADKASSLALDRKIKSYPFINFSENGFTPLPDHNLQTAVEFDRYSDGNNSHRKKHHISEFTVLTNEGARHVYGIPVYNVTQEDYTYSIGSQNEYNAYADLPNNQVNVRNNMEPSKSAMNDQYYSKEIMPAYSTSFLLSGILSPDYVDLTGDGITDDDNGTAIKFNYSKVSSLYKWKTPYNPAGVSKANLVRGLLADEHDDKATLSYGEKELWYVHSIETKNYIAYFITENRKDGYGVASVNGGIDSTGAVQKALREIRMYNKSDTKTPVKVVRFEYSYDLVKGVPNASAGHGKLTLKKVYFLHQNNDKGKFFPYEFEYNNEFVNPVNYDYLSSDRWGTYKPKNANSNNPGDVNPLKNDEFPYTLQVTDSTNKWAQVWLLNKIKLPSGGSIEITYESDDYAYVQDKQAAVMLKVKSMVTGISGGVTSNLWDANGIRVDIGVNAEDYGYSNSLSAAQKLEWFKQNLLAGTDQLMTRMYVDLSGITKKKNPTKQLLEIISCYATVESVNKVSGSGTDFIVIFKKVREHDDDPINPILHAALQKMKLELPQLSYPGYDSRIKDEDASKFKQTITALSNTITNLSELVEGFQRKAKRLNFAQEVDLSKSYVRLVKLDGYKLGGGVRVKKVLLNDAWDELSGVSNAASAKNGMYYEYTTIDNVGRKMSSGVASYEPYIGGEENILKQPVKYIQNIHGAKNNLFFFEEPFGEMLFPSPQVGYSKVTVYSLNAAGEKDTKQQTGYVVQEFFTAKDFPTLHSYQPIDKQNIRSSNLNFLIYSRVVDKRAYTQGFLIELNDMHGKNKRVSNYNNAGNLVSSEEYVYKTGKNYQGKTVPGNIAPVINEKGALNPNGIVGKEIELFSQMNEVYTNSEGHTLFGGSDLVYLLIVPHVLGGRNEEYRRFNYSSTIKTIYRYGIVDKVIKTINGSVSEARNLAYDAYSGQPIIVESSNEFNQPVYTATLPAYWMYEGMAGAYKTAGSYLKGIQTGYNGVIKNQAYVDFLKEGDELFTDNGERLWVVKTVNSNSLLLEKRLIDEWGNVFAWERKGFNATVVRSGGFNQLNSAAASYVTLENPLQSATGLIELVKEGSVASLKVISASAIEYNQERIGDPDCNCPPLYTLSQNKEYCVKYDYINTSTRFDFVSAHVDLTRVNNGATIYQTSSDNSPSVNKKSYFWGGICNNPPPQDHMVVARGINPECPDPVEGCPNEPIDCTKFPHLCEQNPPPVDSCLINPSLCNNGGSNGPDSTYHNFCSDRVNYPSSGLCGRYWTHSIWLCAGPGEDLDKPRNEWIGFEICVNIPETKTYYMAYCIDDKMLVYKNGDSILHVRNATGNTIVKPITLEEGPMSLAVIMENDQPERSGVLLEIYDVTYEELRDGDYVPENKIIFSTGRDVRNNPYVQVFRNMWQTNQQNKYQRLPGINSPVLGTICKNPVIDVRPNSFNPYVNGQLGSWYPQKQYAYLTDRQYNNINNTDSIYMNIGRTGYLEQIVNFWSFNQSLNTWSANTQNTEWVATSTATMVDRLGNVVEELDPLNRYSSAIYGFNNKLPVATASLAQNKEILYESFEDKIGAGSIDTSCVEMFGFKYSINNVPVSSLINTDYSHSGYASLKLTNGVLRYATRANDHRPDTYDVKQMKTNVRSEYQMSPYSTYFIRGFEPLLAKPYIFQAWIRKDGSYVNANDLTVAAHGNNLTLVKKALVEDWMLVEGVFTTTNEVNDLVLSISGNGIYIDDIRVFPAKSLMKSFVYNYINHQLMATLDETGFTSFYEYDDEGNLIRTKRETEKGIVTIQESRKSNKKTSL